MEPTEADLARDLTSDLESAACHDTEPADVRRIAEAACRRAIAAERETAALREKVRELEADLDEVLEG